MRTYYDEALEAIKRLFGNTAVPTETTIQLLKDLRDEIDLLIDAAKEQP